MPKSYRTIAISILAGIALYAGSLAFSDIRAVGEAMGSLGTAGWSGVLSLSVVNYVLRFGRWQNYLNLLGHRIPARQSILYYLGGFAFTTTPGKAGEAVRSLYLKRHNVRYTDSLAALFTERLMDMVAMVLLAALAALSFQQARIPVAILAITLLILLPLVRSRWLLARMGRLQEGLKSERLRSMCGHTRRLMQQSAQLLGNRPLYTGLAVGLVAWGAEGLGLYLILMLMGMELPMALAVGIYAVSVLVGALSFIPGGLGSTEAVMGLMLSLAGADLATAISATLICRIATLWFAVIIGFGCMAFLELSKQRPARPTGT